MQADRIEVTFRRFVKILATIGICYQVISQTRDYFLYPSYTSIETVVVNTRLPAITLCASFWYGKMESHYNSLSVYNASLLMPSYDEVVNFCHLTLPNSSVVNCSSISKPHKFMNHKMICFSLFEKDRTYLPDEQLMYSQDIRLKNDITTDFIRIKFNTPWNDADHYTVTVRSYESPLRLLRSTESKVWLEPRVNEQVVLNYRISRRVELPPPYGSCTNYPKPLNADSSMIKCWHDKFVASNGTLYWPQWTFFDYDANYTDEELSRHWPSTEVHEKDFPSVNEICMRHNSRVDCDRTYIVLFKIAQLKSDEQGKYLIVEVPWPPASQLNITNCIKTTIYQYANEIGGILSMWIGFSICLSYVQLSQSICTMLHRKYNNNNSMPLTSQSHVTGHQSINNDTVTAVTMHPSHHVSRPRRLNNLTMRLICWIATLYFVIEIIQIYFDKPFDTAIKAETPVQLQMLMVSICFDMVIHPHKVKQFYPDVYEAVPSDQWKNIFTVEQILKTTTEWHEVYHPSSTYLSPDNGYVKIHEHFNFTKSITGRYTCFTTFGPGQYLQPGHMRKHLRASISYGTNMYLSLNTSQLHKLNQSRVRVYFHDDGLVREDASAPDRFTIVDQKDARLYPNSRIVRIYRTIRKLHPHHMMSTCWEYEKKFGYNREVLFERCISRNFISRYRVWPSGYQLWQNIAKDDDFKISNLDIADLKFSNDSLREQFNSIQDHCDTLLYKAECDELYVKVRVEDEFFRDTGLTSIILYPPSKQFFAYEQQLIYTIVDIIGYIGGTINAWIGLSFLDFEILLIFIRKVISQECLQTEVSRPRARASIY